MMQKPARSRSGCSSALCTLQKRVLFSYCLSRACLGKYPSVYKMAQKHVSAPVALSISSKGLHVALIADDVSSRVGAAVSASAEDEMAWPSGQKNTVAPPPAGRSISTVETVSACPVSKCSSSTVTCID